MKTPRDPLNVGYRYPAELISYAVWLYFRFPLSLRMVEDMLAARGIHGANAAGRFSPSASAVKAKTPRSAWDQKM